MSAGTKNPRDELEEENLDRDPKVPPSMPNPLQEWIAKTVRTSNLTMGLTELTAKVENYPKLHHALLLLEGRADVRRIGINVVFDLTADIHVKRDEQGTVKSLHYDKYRLTGSKLEKLLAARALKEFSGASSIIMESQKYEDENFYGVYFPFFNFTEGTYTQKLRKKDDIVQPCLRMHKKSNDVISVLDKEKVLFLLKMEGMSVEGLREAISSLNELLKYEPTFEPSTYKDLDEVSSALTDSATAPAHLPYLTSLQASLLIHATLAQKLKVFEVSPTRECANRLKLPRILTKMLYSKNKTPISKVKLSSLLPGSNLICQEMAWDDKYLANLKTDMLVYPDGKYFEKNGTRFRELVVGTTMTATNLRSIVNSVEGYTEGPGIDEVEIITTGDEKETLDAEVVDL